MGSALAAAIFLEPEAPPVVSALAHEQWHAPAVLPFELTNIVGTKMKQAPKEAALIEAALVTVNKKLASYAEI